MPTFLFEILYTVISFYNWLLMVVVLFSVFMPKQVPVSLAKRLVSKVLGSWEWIFFSSPALKGHNLEENNVK